LKQKLKVKRIIELAESYDGAVVPLLLLDMQSKGFLSKLPNAKWQAAINQPQLDNWNWLLAYEGARHGWLKDPKGSILSSDLLKPLASRGVVFFEEKRNVLKREAVVRQKRQKRLQLKRMLSAFLAGYP
jgi:hypothetical protein